MYLIFLEIIWFLRQETILNRIFLSGNHYIVILMKDLKPPYVKGAMETVASLWAELPVSGRKLTTNKNYNKRN
jgi:hypothetical protein